MKNSLTHSLLIVLIFFTACTTDLADSDGNLTGEESGYGQPDDSYEYSQEFNNWVRKINDPYTLDNFQDAYNNLAMTRGNSDSGFAIGHQLSPTHYNVKFTSKTPSEIDYLEEINGVSIMYHPFDIVMMPYDQAADMKQPDATKTAATESSEKRYFLYRKAVL